MCLENALKMGQMKDSSRQGVEIAKMWHVMSVSLGDLNSSKIALWSKHPLGWTLAQKVIAHFERAKDPQQVATIAALILGKEHQIY